MESIGRTLQQEIMNKRALLEKEISTRREFITQKEQELAELINTQGFDLNNLISAHNTLFPDAAIPFHNENSEQHPSSSTNNIDPIEISQKESRPSTPKTPGTSTSTFVPQKPGTEHPLQSIHNMVAEPTPELNDKDIVERDVTF